MAPTAVSSHSDVIAAFPSKAEEYSSSESAAAVPAAAPSYSSTLDTLSLVLSLMGMLGHKREVYQLAQLNKELYYNEDVWDSINSYPILYGAFCVNNPSRLEFLSKREMSHLEPHTGIFPRSIRYNLRQYNFGQRYILHKMNAVLSDNNILLDQETNKQIGTKVTLCKEIETHRVEFIHFLCKCGLHMKGPVLNIAVKWRNHALVEFLCKQGASLNMRPNGRTPLQMIIERYIENITIDTMRGSVFPILHSLFKGMKGRSKKETGLDNQTRNGYTALHMVLTPCGIWNPLLMGDNIERRIELVKALCKLQINTSLVTDKGQTAYDIACEQYGADSDIAKLLETYPH